MATKVYDRRKRISSSTIGDEDDLVLEILIRLPDPKSAFRCRPVCKSWNALISAPYFRRRFVSHHAAAAEPSPALTLSQVLESISSFLPFPASTQSQISVLDSFKDLFLIGFWGWHKNGKVDDPELRRTHLLCNLLTKQWVALPLAPKMAARNSRYRWTVKLVCEPPLDGQEFRVVRMYHPDIIASTKVEVYMFRSTSGRWAKFVLCLDGDLKSDSDYRIAFSDNNEKLYWLNKHRRVVTWDPFRADLGTLPTLLDESSQFNRHNVSGPWVSEGALHIIEMVEHGELMDLRVWRLDEKEGGGGWSKRYEVENLRCKGVIFVAGRETSEMMKDLDWQRPQVVGLHPEKSEIVFFAGFDFCTRQSFILSWDFRRKQFGFLDYESGADWYLTHQDYWVFFQPRVALWPTLILSHEKLRNTYNGSYDCWLPSDNQPR